MSLAYPHRIWTIAVQKSYEVAKARIQLLFLSSQYPCAKFSRHWSKDNPQGLCSFSHCQESQAVESPEHILLNCPAYASTRNTMIALCLQQKDPVSHNLVTSFLLSGSPSKMMQFLLDSSALPEVNYWAQNCGDQVYSNLFYLSRNWCFALHRECLKRLCKWNFR